MISTILYNLCILISTPYDNLNMLSDNFDYIKPLLLEKIYLDKLFRYMWRKKIGSIVNNFKHIYKYTILEENFNFIKVKINFTTYFKVKSSPENIFSAHTSEYIAILERTNDKFKVQFLIESEENPIYYNYFLINNLTRFENYDSYIDKLIFNNQISAIDLSYRLYNEAAFQLGSSSVNRNESNFSVSKACTYAETFALNPNKNYKYFDGVGGDCTNFASQILHAGGIRETKTWTPYTNPWIRVEELYTYLTTTNLGYPLSPNVSSLTEGCLIQFYTPLIGRFFHNGFVTHKLPNNEVLYCCHSYNRLNYPLSEVYPNKYPTLRSLKFN